MFIRSVIICTYLLGAYWLSTHYSMLKLFFYPTLGAFSYFVITRQVSVTESCRLISAAVAASFIGSLLHFLYPGTLSFFITCILTLAMMQRFNIQAAPVLAVSLIAFFSNLTSFWMLPVSVLCSLSGLFMTLGLAQLAETKWVQLRKKQPAGRESASATDFQA
ncbi:hypothetical protein [Paenibacillus hamazuiensis]|uniref:hypothetical protein n=1 Tax=Paenibacillus hamazuiensis TaxID=2936508 RepID=UPI00200BB490|nr:hypothetical protein [Paenibacillus hamazuiensis]